MNINVKTAWWFIGAFSTATASLVAAAASWKDLTSSNVSFEDGSMLSIRGLDGLWTLGVYVTNSGNDALSSTDAYVAVKLKNTHSKTFVSISASYTTKKNQNRAKIGCGAVASCGVFGG